MRLLTILKTTMLLAVFASPPSYAQPRPALPAVTSYSLDKVKVSLPDDLAGQQNVLILYFRPDQSDAAVAWATALQPVKYAHPTLQTYVLPVYSKENFLYRWWIEASLRSSAPPAQEWRYTVPVFVDKNRFMPALKIANEKSFTVLLTDRQGRVEWRTEGPLDDAKMAALQAALMAAFNSSGVSSSTSRLSAHSVGH